MRKIQPVVLGALLGLAYHASAQDCPSKVSNRLCLAYSDSGDSAFLKVRVMLDPSLWAPSKPEDNNPLVAAARGMFEKYDFKTIENPDSAYRPRFLNGGSPSILEVLYHNVLLPKNRLDSISEESYVKEFQLGCRKTVSTGLCDTFNLSVDTAWIKLFLRFRSEIENDTAAMMAYLSKFDTRNPENISEIFTPESIVKFPVRGLAVSRAEFEKMSADPEVHGLDGWYKVTTGLFFPNRKGKSTFRLNHEVYSVDGRRVEKKLEKDFHLIIKKK